MTLGPIRYGRPLAPGDQVALICPAGPAKNPAHIDEVTKYMEKHWGFRIRVGRHAREHFDVLAGPDEHRLADLNDALRDPEIRGIICYRGGYGTARIVGGVDYDAIRRDPKVFVGFSDISTLHGGFLRHAGLASIHGPMPVQGLGPGGIDADSERLLLHLMTSTEPFGSLRQNFGWPDPLQIRGGKARGRLIGGNLVLFCHLLGTKDLPSPEGSILFVEDVGEEGYRIDRAFQHLRNAGYLDALEGLILGQFSDSEPTEPGRFRAPEVLERCTKDLRIPVLANAPAGHEKRNAALPFGTIVEMDADAGDIIFTESLARKR